MRTSDECKRTQANTAHTRPTTTAAAAKNMIICSLAHRTSHTYRPNSMHKHLRSPHLNRMEFRTHNIELERNRLASLCVHVDFVSFSVLVSSCFRLGARTLFILGREHAACLLVPSLCLSNALASPCSQLINNYLLQFYSADLSWLNSIFSHCSATASMLRVFLLMVRSKR